MLESIPLDIIVPFLIVCPFAFLAGAIDAIAGGGGLISLPAFFMTGIPVHTALGTNKLLAWEQPWQRIVLPNKASSKLDGLFPV